MLTSIQLYQLDPIIDYLDPLHIAVIRCACGAPTCKATITISTDGYIVMHTTATSTDDYTERRAITIPHNLATALINLLTAYAFTYIPPHTHDTKGIDHG